VLLDIKMPRMSGHDVLKVLRKKHGYSELPVIVLTAKNPLTDLVLGFQSGANDYLLKPFLFEELMARIRFQLEIKRAYRTLRENANLKLSLADQRRKKIEARLQARQTALEMLRFQLNPHFLFNALASIRGALVRRPETARGMVTALSEFCRLSLAYGMESRVPLERETALVKHYLEIEKTRQGDRMQVEEAFDGSTLNHLVPAFLLQPLVENAVKYGRITSPVPLKLRLASRFRENRLVVTVANTGAWVTPGSENPEQGAGVGLENIGKRLEKMYPGQFGFSQVEREGWVVVEVCLPEQ
jgi:LytS/YehU family sensor histidine kinase